MFKPPKGWVPWVYPTSLFIRDYLREHGPTYPFKIYQALKEARRRVWGERAYVGRAANFYKYIWCLERLGLIRRTGKIEPSRRGRGGIFPQPKKKFWRVYYEIVPERIADPAWLNPQKALYGKLK